MWSEAMSAQLTFFLLWKDWHFINNFVCLLLQIFFICILHRWELCVTKLHYAFIYTNNECQLLKHATVWKQLRKSRLLCTQERFLRVNRLLQNYSAVNTIFFFFNLQQGCTFDASEDLIWGLSVSLFFLFFLLNKTTLTCNKLNYFYSIWEIKTW